jgi:hypothetical protein
MHKLRSHQIKAEIAGKMNSRRICWQWKLGAAVETATSTEPESQQLKMEKI